MTTSRAWQKIAAATFVLLTFQAAAWAATAFSKADRVNVRSRPGFIGEIVTQLKKGQAVSVLDTVTLKKPAADEPPTWMKIELPPDSPAWANAEFVDPSNGLVKGDLLNIRAGPTYDHGIVGRAKRGSTLKILAPGTNGWVQVAAPAGSVGFVPASWLADSAAAVAASVPPGVPPAAPAAGTGPSVPRSASVTNAISGSIRTNAAPSSTLSATTPAVTRTVSTNATRSSVTNKSTAVTPPPRSASKPISDNAWLEQFVSRPASQANPGNGGTAAAPATPAVTVPSPAAAPATTPEPTPVPPAVVTPSTAEPVRESAVRTEPPKADGRWVRREGLVVRPANIAAPSFYALKKRGSGGLMNFLIAPKAGPDAFREYRGRVVIVTGREYLDRRPYWRDIPLLDVETIEVVR